DVECFEADPHGMSRIGQPAMGEGVRQKKVAERIVNAGKRDAQPVEQGNASNNDRHEEQGQRDRAVFRDPRERPLNSREIPPTQAWSEQRIKEEHNERKAPDGKFDGKERANESSAGKQDHRTREYRKEANSGAQSGGFSANDRSQRSISISVSRLGAGADAFA